MSRVFLVAIVLSIASIGMPAPAQAQSWIQVGPPGGNVRALASDPRDPRRIYLGTAGGILYRSDDAGLHWRRLTPGFPLRGCSLDEIAVGDRGVVFVGYWEVDGTGGGVARSTDRGQTFTLLKGINGESVRALALAPSDPRIIAAGTLAGVFLSHDGGRGWKRITPEGNADLRNIESVAFDPQNPEVIYIGTWHLGWKTLDAGANWLPLHRGMIEDSDVMTLTVDRRDPQTVYASACTGIYRSSEGAKEWTKLVGIPYSSRRTRAFAQAGEEGNVLLAGTTEGLWISEDRGGRWRLVTPKELIVNAILVQPEGSILLGTEEAGVLRSSDRGRTWTASNAGFLERFVSRMVFDDAGQRLLVAVRGDPRYGGVFVSTGIREPWVHLGEGLEGRQVLTLALLDDRVFAGTDDGMFVLEPNGTAWARVPTQLDARDVHWRVTEILARSPGRLLAATSRGIIRSPDGGRTWTRQSLGKDDEIRDLAAFPGNLDHVMAATQTGFYRSEDGGDTWNQVSPALGGVTTHALAFLPTNARVLFTTTTGGLFRSDDAGTTWEAVSGGIPRSDLTGLAIHPDGRTIYASDFTWGGVFRSTNRGLTWKRMPVDGLASDRVWTLGIDPASPDQLLVASSAGGLHLLLSPSMATGETGEAQAGGSVASPSGAAQ